MLESSLKKAFERTPKGFVVAFKMLRKSLSRFSKDFIERCLKASKWFLKAFKMPFKGVSKASQLQPFQGAILDFNETMRHLGNRIIVRRALYS